jgi:hypothetical protein
MSDQSSAFDLPDDLDPGMSQSPEIRALLTRLTTDGHVWQSRLPDAGHVAERIRGIPSGGVSLAPPESAARPWDDQSTQETERQLPPITPLSPPPGPGTRLFGLVAAIVIVALIGAVLAQLAGHAGKFTGPAATPAPNVSPTVADSTSSPSASPSVVPTDTTASGSGPGATATTTSLAVTDMLLVMTGQSYSGVCSETMTYHFDLTITVGADTGGGNVDFNWIYSGGTDTYTSPPPQQLTQAWSSGAFTQADSVLFNAGETTKTVDFQLPINAVYGDGKSMWLQAVVAGPNRLSSPQVGFSLTCVHEITNFTAADSPNTWTAPCGASQAITFTYTFTISPGPPTTLFITEQFSAGFATWVSPTSDEWHTTTGPSQTLTYTDQNTLDTQSPNGTFWGQISIASSETGAPYAQSPQATVTKSC